MRIVVLAGGIGGARFLLGVRAYARRDRRRGDRRRQRRRRPPAARAADLPRPGQRHVHPGRRRRPGARLGPGRRDLDGQGASWPRTAPNRPGSASATRTSPPIWCAPRCSTPAIRSRRSPRRCATRWQPGVRLLPATDDRLETHAVVDRRRAAHRAIHFQEWWVRYRAEIPTDRFVFVGADAAKPAPGVLDAIGSADVVLLAPSNPVVSIAPDPGRTGDPGGRRRGARPPVVGRLPDHRRRAGARDGRPLPRGDRRRVQRRRGRRALRRPRRAAACSTAGWSTAPTPGRRCRAWTSGPLPLRMTDEAATAAMVAAAVEAA